MRSGRAPTSSGGAPPAAARGRPTGSVASTAAYRRATEAADDNKYGEPVGRSSTGIRSASPIVTSPAASQYPPGVEVVNLGMVRKQQRESAELDGLAAAFDKKVGIGSRRGGGPPRNSAARSHEVNDAYMEEFHEAHDAMVVAAGGTVARGSSAPKGRGLSRGSSFGAAGAAVAGVRAAPGPAVARHVLDGSTCQSVITDVTPSWYTGPVDPAGVLLDTSDRPILCMSMSGGDEVVVGCSDHALYTFDINTGRKRRTLYSKKHGHSEWVTCCAFLPDGRIVSGGMDNKICLWAARGATCTDLTGHTSSVSTLKVDYKGTLAISASYDKTLRAWDLGTGREAACLSGGHSGPILDLAWVGATVVSGGRDGNVVAWDLGTGTQLGTMKGHRGHVTAVSGMVSEDSTLFLTGAQDGHVRVWDIRTRSSVANVPVHVTDAGTGAVGSIMPTAMAPKYSTAIGGDLVITMGADKTVAALDPRASYKVLHRFAEHRDFIYSLQVVGPLVLSGAGDGMVLVHDLVDGKLLYGLGVNKGAVRCLGATLSRLVAAGDDGSALILEYR